MHSLYSPGDVTASLIIIPGIVCVVQVRFRQLEVRQGIKVMRYPGGIILAHGEIVVLNAGGE